MGITEEQKAVLVNHFSNKGFVEAFKAYVVELQIPASVVFSAQSKNSFHEEAMSLLLAKGTYKAFDSLLRGIASLEEEAAAERQVQPDQA